MSENLSMACTLAACVIRPSSLAKRKFSRRRASSIKSKKEVNWDTTRLLIEGFWFLMTTSAFNNALSWKKKKKKKRLKRTKSAFLMLHVV